MSPEEIERQVNEFKVWTRLKKTHGQGLSFAYNVKTDKMKKKAS